jgi:3-phenylpropionate/trans-cinnamate dioxygenase ferredoxin reductase component
MKRFVIIGAGEAGARAAMDLRGQGSVTLIGDEPHLPYERPPLSKPDGAGAVLKLIGGENALDHVNLRTGVAVRSIDRSVKSVHLTSGETLPYDRLLLATGATPRVLPCDGGHHALVLRKFEDAQDIYRRAETARTAVIIGAGLIGLELAAVLCDRGISVTVLEAGPRGLGRALSEDMAQFVIDRHRRAGVIFRFDARISHLTENAVHLAEGEPLPADLIVAAIGVTPNTALAAAAGIDCDNGIRVNAQLATSDPDIFAAGDCANLTLPDVGPTRLEAWRAAVEMGAAAAKAMTDSDVTHEPRPWFWSDQYELGLQAAGFHDPTRTCVTRKIIEGVLFFELDMSGKLVSVAGIGPGNAVAKDVKIAERMIANGAVPALDRLANSDVPMKTLLRAG